MGSVGANQFVGSTVINTAITLIYNSRYAHYEIAFRNLIHRTFYRLFYPRCEVHRYAYFRCYTVHVVELLNYYTNHCTYIKFIKFTP